MLKKVWPFKRKNPDGSDAGETQTELALQAQSVAPQGMPSAPQDSSKAEVSDGAEATVVSESAATSEEEVDDPKEMAQILSNNFSSGSFSQFVERTQEMARQIKRESQDQAAKRWADGMSQQIMAEKVRLGALSQKINQAIRQKEQDLKKREQKFAEDLRRKEEALHHKTIALSRAKDQVAQLTTQLERQKGAKGASGEESNFKQKYQLSQRMLTSLREENTKLVSKLEEAKAQVVSTAKAADSTAQIELANLKSKQDQMMRQNMQLKSLNEQLMRRMSQNSAKAAEKPDRSAVEEMKRKYEATAKISEQQQKELTQLKAKLDKLSKEETRWVTDLAKKEAELRKTKTELEQLQSQLNAGKKAEKKAS
jgi:colicin import membrane protein